VERLKHTALTDTAEREEFQNLGLWPLAIGAIKASPANRLLFIEGITRTVERLHISTWDKATLIVESVL
jgi:hypothetical protein